MDTSYREASTLPVAIDMYVLVARDALREEGCDNIQRGTLGRSISLGGPDHPRPDEGTRHGPLGGTS